MVLVGEELTAAAGPDGPKAPSDVDPRATAEQAESGEPTRVTRLPVELVRPRPTTGQDRWVDHGLALLLRDRLREADAARAREVAHARVTAARADEAPVDDDRASVHNRVTEPIPAIEPPRIRASVPAVGPFEPTLGLLRARPARDVEISTFPRPHRLRSPVAGLPLALLIGLLAAVLGWLTAAPFWLAHGVGDTGVAVVTRCEPSGWGARCTGRFTAGDGAYTMPVRFADLDPHWRTSGLRLRARMLDRESGVIYTGPLDALRFRWLIGAALALGCGWAIGAVTGVSRLGAEGYPRVVTLWLLSFVGALALYATAIALAHP